MSTEYTDWQWPLSGALSIMMVKSAQLGEGGGARPPSLTLSTITSKVVVYIPAEWADTRTLPLFLLYPYMCSVCLCLTCVTRIFLCVLTVLARPLNFFTNFWSENTLVSRLLLLATPVHEFIDPVFTKTSPKRSFSLNRKRAFWLVFAKTGAIISGTVDFHLAMCRVPNSFFCEEEKNDVHYFVGDSVADPDP